MAKIAVVVGGPSEEAEISRKSGRAVARALQSLGFEVEILELTPDIALRLMSLKPDLVYPVLHGKPGEDGSFQGLLEIMDIPYVGENVKVSALCMDKDWTKRLLRERGLPTPRWIVVDRNQKGLKNWASFPAVVKPAEGGSSIGVEIVKDFHSLERAINLLLQKGEKILVEEYIHGLEFTCGYAVGRVFTPLRIEPKGEFYDYRIKYTKGSADFIPEEGPLGEELKRLTSRVVETLEIGTLCRVDFRYNPENGKFYILEVNTIPGMTETSLLPMMAAHDGFTFEELVKMVVETKLTR